jgi:hypothetical protein
MPYVRARYDCNVGFHVESTSLVFNVASCSGLISLFSTRHNSSPGLDGSGYAFSISGGICLMRFFRTDSTSSISSLTCSRLPMTLILGQGRLFG